MKKFKPVGGPFAGQSNDPASPWGGPFAGQSNDPIGQWPQTGSEPSPGVWFGGTPVKYQPQGDFTTEPGMTQPPPYLAGMVNQPQGMWGIKSAGPNTKLFARGSYGVPDPNDEPFTPRGYPMARQSPGMPTPRPQEDPTDTVPAMLTPKEAVLTPSASELAGRHNIDALNQQARPYDDMDRTMGLPPATSVQMFNQGTQGYGEGTRKVQQVITPTDEGDLVYRPNVPDSMRMIGAGMSGGPAGLSPAIMGFLMKMLSEKNGTVPFFDVGREGDRNMSRNPLTHSGEPQRFAAGSGEINPIGYVPPELQDPQWAQVQLQAPQLNLAAFADAAKKKGLNAGQVLSLLSLMKGHGGTGTTDWSGNIAQGVGYAIGTSRVGGVPPWGNNASATDPKVLSNKASLPSAQPAPVAPMNEGTLDDGYGDSPPSMYFDNLTRFNSPFFQALPSNPAALGIALYHRKFARGTSKVQGFRRGEVEVGFPGGSWQPPVESLGPPPDIPPISPEPNTTAPGRIDRGGIEAPAWAEFGDPSQGNQFLSQLWSGGFGQWPVGNPISGPTTQPTFWSNMNTGNPMAWAPIGIPAGGWTPSNILNISTHRHTPAPHEV